ncbi:MAG TPA: class I SAM-dependent methyltransferase [Rudaea sp.]|jgi:SAM-dependent methyltransferase|uniref:class I SAM-dependent methyltransferase n=1 Tax=Rudaea sp. TaxID=2136325 RepID=UPI002F9456A6
MKVWQEFLGVEDAEVKDYHRLARRELIDLFSSPRKRIVEIGCAAGYTGKYAKQKFAGVEYWGFDLNKAAAKEALQNLDRVVCGKFEEQQLDLMGLEPRSVDGVVLGDVLEHMYDPWSVLTALSPWLTADAELVISLPHVRNLWLLNEIAEGRFTYDQHGLLDITHIRFFTGNEIRELMDSTGYSIAMGQLVMDERLQDYYVANQGRTGPCIVHYRSISIKTTGETLAEFCAKQFLIRAIPKKGLAAPIDVHPSYLPKSIVADHEASRSAPQAASDRLLRVPEQTLEMP